MSALFMLSNMTSRGYGPRIVARELALCLAGLNHRPDILEHTPGICNKVADELSRRYEPGHTFVLPAVLQHAKEAAAPARARSFYLALAEQPALQMAM